MSRDHRRASAKEMMMSKRRIRRLAARDAHRSEQRAGREERAADRARRNEPRARLIAFVEQFPAVFSADDDLYLRANPERVEAVSVSPCDRELLSFRPRRDSSDGNLVGIDDRERVLLFGADWNILGEVRPEHDWWTPRNSGHEEGESIGDALLRLDAAGRGGWIVKIHSGYEVVDHHSVGGYEVVVYRVPDACRGWMAEDMDSARTRLADEAEAAI